MLTLYHGKTSVCSVKARLALAEKDVGWEGRLLTLRGDQFDPDYLKLNPNAVVPTLVHDGRIVIELTVIMHYVDEAFPGPSLDAVRSRRARQAALDHQADGRTRAHILHDAHLRDRQPCAFRPHDAGGTGGRACQGTRPQALGDQAPGGRDAPTRRPWPRRSRQQERLLEVIEKATQDAPWLAGRSYSLADAAATPYVWRLDKPKLAAHVEQRPGVAAWYDRVRARPSFKTAVEDWLTPADHERLRQRTGPLAEGATLLRAA